MRTHEGLALLSLAAVLFAGGPAAGAGGGSGEGQARFRAPLVDCSLMSPNRLAHCAEEAAGSADVTGSIPRRGFRGRGSSEAMVDCSLMTPRRFEWCPDGAADARDLATGSTPPGPGSPPQR